MNEKLENQGMVEELWRKMLTTGEYGKEVRQRQFLRFLPGDTRCKICYAPFQGIGGTISWIIYHKRPSNLNPRLCTTCEAFARTHRGGAEIELSLLFVDVRGSTALAEGMSATAYGELINRFYTMSTEVLATSDALIDKIIGDQASGIFVPGFAGSDHARRAIEAGKTILKLTGHNGKTDEPWIPLGAGVHTGKAFVGSLGGKNGVTDITVLGDVANTAARLSSVAGIGEILISESAYRHARYSTTDQLEQRLLELKGKSDKVLVNVFTI
jgi:adenylate cyclase